MIVIETIQEHAGQKNQALCVDRLRLHAERACERVITLRIARVHVLLRSVFDPFTVIDYFEILRL